MNRLSGFISAMNIGADALRAFAGGVGITAHNIANVSTENFTPLKTAYETGPNGIGVRPQPLKQAEKDLLAVSGDNTPHPSGTDIAIEFPQLIRTQRDFEANVRVMRAAADMMGSILDTKA